MDRVRRRLVGGSFAAVLASPLDGVGRRLAQAGSPVRRVVLFDSNDTDSRRQRQRQRWLAWFAEQGFVEGSNLRFDIVDPNKRAAATPVPAQAGVGELERAAQSVVASRPDLICVPTTIWTQTFARLTKEIPIVFFNVGDPVKAGIVQSFSTPGGNLTGTTNRALELRGKQLELLKELKPSTRRVGVLLTSAGADRIGGDETSDAAKRLGIQLIDIDASGVEPDIDGIIRVIQRAKLDALHYSTWRTDLATPAFLGFLQTAALPAVFREWWMVQNGGLISLGYPPGDAKRAVAIAARVLRGEKPATISIDQLAKFHLAVNLRTARAIGVKIPQSILLKADQVIE